MGLDSVEFRDAIRMDTIEQLGLALAETICGAPIIANGVVDGGIRALPESPPAMSYMENCSQLQVLLQVGKLYNFKHHTYS